MMADQDQVTAAAPETPAAFLEALASALKSKADVDQDLAGILTTHVLVAAPTKDAVAKAKAAIVKLAQSRAVPPTPKPTDG